MTYIAFYGDDYYPAGGCFDKHKIFIEEDECREFCKSIKDDWVCYLDVANDKTYYYKYNSKLNNGTYFFEECD